MRDEDMYFPPGEPTGEEDPRQLLNEFWRVHDRMRDAPYGERYVAFMGLVARAAALSESGWSAFQRLYQRDHARRRLPTGTESDWMDRTRGQRSG